MRKNRQLYFKTTKQQSSLYHLLVASFLWVDIFPAFIQKIFLLFTYTQYIAVLIYTQFKFIVKDQNDIFTIALDKICSILVFKESMIDPENSSAITIKFLLLWIYFLVFLIIIAIVLIKFFMKKDLNRNERYFIFVISHFHLSFGFWSSTCLLFESLSSAQTQGLIFGLYSPQSVSVKVFHVIIIIVNYFFGFWASLFSYDPITSLNVLSSHSSTPQLLLFILKALIVPIIALNNYWVSISALWYLSLCCIILAFIMIFHLTFSFPYGKYQTMKISLNFTAVAMLISLTNILVLSFADLKTISKMSLVYIEILLGVFAVKQSNIYIKHIVQKYLAIPDKDLKSENAVLKKLFAFSYSENAQTPLGTGKFDLSELQLKGSISNSIDQEFALKLAFSNQSETQEKKSEKIFFEIYKQKFLCLFLSSVQRIGNCSTLKVMVANYLFQNNINHAKAIKLLLEVSKTKSLTKLIGMRLLHTFQSDLYEEAQTNNMKSLNLKSLVDFEIVSTQLTETIYSISQKYLRFWESYKADNLMLMNIKTQSEIIEKEAEEIKQLWDKEIRPNITFSKLLCSLYTQYLDLVRNSPFTAHKIKKQTGTYLFQKDIEDGSKYLTNKNLFSPNNIILTISGGKDNPGKIIRVSANVTELLGWDKEDLIGNDSNILRMRTRKERHHQTLSKIAEDSLITSDEESIETFLQTKKGYIKPVLVYFSIYPYFKNELIYTVIIRVANPDAEIIVLNEEGIVDGVTFGIGDCLKIPVHKKLTIYDICKNTDELCLPFQDVPHRNLNTNTKSFTESPEFTNTYTLTLNKLAQQQQFEKREVFLELFDMNYKQHSSFPSTQGFSGILKAMSLYNEPCYVLYLKLNNLVLCKKKEKEDKNEQVIEYRKSVSTLIIPEEKEKTMTESLQSPDSATRFLNPATPREPYQSKTHPFSKLRTKEFASIQKPLPENEPEIEETSDILQEQQMEEGNSFSARNHTQREQTARKRLIEDDIKSTHSISLSDSTSRMERAVYGLGQESRTKLFTGLFLLTSLLCGIFLIIFQIENTRISDSVAENTITVSNSTRRLTKVVEVYGFAMKLHLTSEGLLLSNRLAFISPSNYTIANRGRFAIAAPVLSSYNNALRSSITYVEREFRDRFFEKILVLGRDSNLNGLLYRESNSFELIAEIVAASYRIAAETVNQNYTQNPDIQFIINNSFNSLLVKGEELLDIVVASNERSLDSIEELLTVFTIVSALLTVTLLVMFVLFIVKFTKDRQKLMNVFLRLNEEDLEKHTALVAKFCNSLQKNDMNGRMLNSIFTQNNSITEFSRVKKSRIGKIREGNEENINKKLVRLAFTGLLLSLTLFIGYIVAFPITETRLTHIKSKLETILDSDSYQYRAILILQQVYDYIGKNGTTSLRGNLISEEWDVTMKQLQVLQSKFIKLTQMNSYSIGDPRIADILVGNLCNNPFLSDGLREKCPTIFHGFSQRGVLQVAEYLLTVIQNVKTSFDRSPRTYSDSKEILGLEEFVQGDTFAYIYWIPCYEIISDILRLQLKEDTDKFNRGKGALFYLWGVLYIIGGSLAWWQIVKAFNRERAAWRKLIRLIPTSIVSTNKLIKSYLMINK